MDDDRHTSGRRPNPSVLYLWTVLISCRSHTAVIRSWTTAQLSDRRPRRPPAQRRPSLICRRPQRDSQHVRTTLLHVTVSGLPSHQRSESGARARFHFCTFPKSMRSAFEEPNPFPYISYVFPCQLCCVLLLLLLWLRVAHSGIEERIG
jgi:hypothetical protein